jgi:hypothetical protein
MMDFINSLLRDIDVNIVITLISIMVLWIFIHSIRWILNYIIIFLVIAFVVWRVPTVHHFIISLLK